MIRFGHPSRLPAKRSLVIADPEFDLTSGTGAQAGSRDAIPTRHSRDLDDYEFHFARLPGTRVEGKLVARRLGAEPWLDRHALEGRVKRECRSPRVLHFASHGFFLNDQRTQRAEPSLLESVRGWRDGDLAGRLRGKLPENPLLRSGLALAGAETWIAGGEPPIEAEDGLLTGEDVAGLDLKATELVVLSACDTGLGEVRVGEGVFGLRRAFVLAGAKTLVMSLWKVSDLATAILMDRFYHNALERRLSRAQALRDAQLYVRSLTVGDIRGTWLGPLVVRQFAERNSAARQEMETLVRASNDTVPFSHPYFWGGFVCLGDPAPLPAQRE